MNFARQLAVARAGGARNEDFGELASLALDVGEEEVALPLVQAAARQSGAVRLWQWMALLHRALDEHQAAFDAFGEAARLAPADAGIAHGRAHVALEAGFDAVALFETAERLGPPNGEILIGLAAARWASNRGEEAEAALDAIVAEVPLWIQGHVKLAHLRALMGRPADASASFERALAQQRDSLPLWRGLLDLHLAHEDHAAQASCVERAQAAGLPLSQLVDHAAIAAAELGETDRADRLFSMVPDVRWEGRNLWHVRHLLRADRLDQALLLIDEEIRIGGARRTAIWPYAYLAWRLTADPRYEWLVGADPIVRQFDLRDQLPPLDIVADRLRSIHIAKGEYLDQSVRGGTQTDGPLFCRVDPVVCALREAIARAVGSYVSDLPSAVPDHPLLAPRRDRRLRFAGSWSVRLRGEGYHANHVHPHGWISSALYITLPPKGANEAPDAGWLTLGEPQAGLVSGLPPTHHLEPEPGRLFLFPSWLWHGTRPFNDGERLTVAFDVAMPR